ncbi:hypothetical protein D3C87_1254340 [compost metagenome]
MFVDQRAMRQSGSFLEPNTFTHLVQRITIALELGAEVLVGYVVVRQHGHPEFLRLEVLVDDCRLRRVTDAVSASRVAKARDDFKHLHVVIELNRERGFAERTLHPRTDAFAHWVFDDHHLRKVTSKHRRPAGGDVPDERVESVQRHQLRVQLNWVVPILLRIEHSQLLLYGRGTVVEHRLLPLHYRLALAYQLYNVSL